MTVNQETKWFRHILAQTGLKLAPETIKNHPESASGVGATLLI